MKSLTKLDSDQTLNFTKLLNIVSFRLNNNCVSIELDREAKELEINLIEKRKEYFKQKIIFDHIVSLVTNSQEFTKNQREFNDAFIDTQIFQSLSNNGFKNEDFINPSLSKNISLNKSEVMQKNIEESLKGDLSEIISNLHTRYTALMHHPEGGAKRLPELIKCDLQKLETLNESLHHKKTSTMQAHNNYLLALSSTSSVTSQIMHKHLLHSLPCNLLTNVSYMHKQLDALDLKLKTTRMGVLMDTYSKDIVKVLGYIRKELRKEIEETKSESSSQSSLLASYEDMGNEFSDMVEKYSKLRDEIENKKWALNEVKKSKI